MWHIYLLHSELPFGGNKHSVSTGGSAKVMQTSSTLAKLRLMMFFAWCIHASYLVSYFRRTYVIFRPEARIGHGVHIALREVQLYVLL